jgi:hypothetical protein
MEPFMLQLHATKFQWKLSCLSGLPRHQERERDKNQTTTNRFIQHDKEIPFLT